jgi:hypothetical protein
VKKFTFKTTQPTGRYRSFDRASHDIKLGGVVVGFIEPTAPYKARLMATKKDINEDGNPNCPWKWVRLKREFGSVQEAKDTIRAASAQIQAEITIYIDKE